MQEKSLQKKFIVFISTTIIITAIISALIYSYINYTEKTKSFQNNINKIVKSILPFYKTYLWQIDTENLKNVSHSLISANKIFCQIKVFNEDKKLIFNFKKNSDLCKNYNILEIRKKIFFNKEYLGSINFYFSKYNVNNSVKKLFIYSLSLGIVISLVVILVIIFIFKKFFSTPLLNIINKLQEISSGNYNIKLQETEYAEINEIIKNLNKMLQAIKVRDINNIELTKKLHSLINNMPGGLIITDEYGNFKEINNSLCEKLKMKKDEILTKNFYLLSSKKFGKNLFKEKLEKINKSGYDEFEWEFIDKEKNILPVLIKGKKIKQLDENLIIFNITNIEYIKQLEKELLIKEKLESLGILAGGIAHDFNNILTSISGGLELIKILIENGKYEKAKERISKIFKPIETAKNLTHQLLTFSKGGAPLKKTFFELNELIKDTVSFVLSGTSINVNFEMEDKLPPVKIDPEQISQVIQNIVINAKQVLNNKGEIKVKVLTEGKNIKIFIRDNGPGIKKEILDKIWQPYYTTKSDGNGLGLSIVYSIIKKHNGDIKVHSVPGEYTEFEIILPIYEETTSIDYSIKEKNNKIENFKETLNILVMDDNKTVRETFIELLKLLNCNVEAVENGGKVIELFKKKRFDITFLDLTVKGGMGATDCIKELLKIDKNVKAIIVSGYSDNDVMINYREYGFSGCITKPFTINDLKKIIESVLKI